MFFFCFFCILYVKKKTLSFIPSLQRTRGHQLYLIAAGEGEVPYRSIINKKNWGNTSDIPSPTLSSPPVSDMHFALRTRLRFQKALGLLSDKITSFGVGYFLTIDSKGCVIWCVTQPSGRVRDITCAGDSVRLEKRIKSQKTASAPYAPSHFICKEPDRDHDESCAEKRKEKRKERKGRVISNEEGYVR